MSSGRYLKQKKVKLFIILIFKILLLCQMNTSLPSCCVSVYLKVSLRSSFDLLSKCSQWPVNSNSIWVSILGWKHHFHQRGTLKQCFLPTFIRLTLPIYLFQVIRAAPDLPVSPTPLKGGGSALKVQTSHFWPPHHADSEFICNSSFFCQ